MNREGNFKETTSVRSISAPCLYAFDTDPGIGVESRGLFVKFDLHIQTV